MHIDPWTIGLQAINALVLIWLLARFFFRPITAIVAERRQAAARLLSDAEAARARAAAEAVAIGQQRSALNDEAAHIRAKARAAAEAERDAVLAQGRADAEARRLQADIELARDQARLRATLQTQACQLAVDVAARLLGRIPPTAVTHALIEQLTRDVAALPATERRLLADDACQLEAVTAADLEESDRARITGALGRALDVTPVIAFRADPAVLAGFELRGPHTLIRNSWRADLEQITHDLTAEPAHA